MHDPKTRAKLLENPFDVPRWSDEDVFPSGETYLDRLFVTIHLWEKTRAKIHQNPEKKLMILHQYEQKVRKLLQRAQSEADSVAPES
ncbi:MAG: hypothetical protein ACE5OZ_05810 [Candidatus Heimdallarchaeota archaeon]